MSGKSPGKTLTPGAGETLKESVERDRRRQELQKQITVLQAKVRREKLVQLMTFAKVVHMTEAEFAGLALYPADEV